MSAEISSSRDVDALAIADPDQYERLLRGYNLLLGNDSNVESDDLRIGHIRPVSHLDPRRYTMGLDRITAHMKPARPGQLTAIGAREGHGKTAYAQLIAFKNAHHHRVLFASLEMTREEILNRILGQLMHCSEDEVEQLRSEDDERYVSALSELRRVESNLYIWRPRKRRDRSIEAITKMAMDVSSDVLVIDHSREIYGWRAGERAEQVMEYLGDFARETRTATFLLSQLNRDAAVRRPHNGNFQDTAKVEQKADRCILLWRPFLGHPKRDHVVEIIVTKNRTGPTFRGHGFWHGRSMRFNDVTDEDEAGFECCKRNRQSHVTTD